jgi:de-etiolated-1
MFITFIIRMILIVHYIICFVLFFRFYARDSGLLKFRIYAGVVGRNAPPTARRLVAFTFHPSEPFAISVQRTNAEYVVNFHIRHSVNS